MTKLKQFVFNPFQENTFVLYDDTGECIIVDAGCYTKSEQEELVTFIETKGLKPKYAINTHGHVDHVLGNRFVKEKFNIEILAHGDDVPLMQSALRHAMMYGLAIDDVPSIERMLLDGEVIEFGNSKLIVIHTPGHSLGGICLYCKESNFLLSGDTLFRASIGRTDLPGGNYDQLIDNISSKLLSLDDSVVVYPGHGDSSTIGWEKDNNPFLNEQ